MSFMGNQRDVPHAFMDMSFDLPGADLFQQLPSSAAGPGFGRTNRLAISAPAVDGASARFVAKAPEQYTSSEARESFAANSTVELTLDSEEEEPSSA